METFSNQAGNEKKPVFIALKIRMSVYRRVPEKKKSKKNKLNFPPPAPTPFCVPKRNLQASCSQWMLNIQNSRREV